MNFDKTRLLGNTHVHVRISRNIEKAFVCLSNSTMNIDKRYILSNEIKEANYSREILSKIEFMHSFIQILRSLSFKTEYLIP